MLINQFPMLYIADVNDIDYAIDKTSSYLQKHSKSKDDFEL